MKKILFLLAAILMINADAIAQTQTAYCDVYARGGAKKMKITIMYRANRSKTLATKTNLGDVLNMLAQDGWVLDKDIVIPRHWQWSMATRHKLHLIMKKEYLVGENPFALFGDNTTVTNSKVQAQVQVQKDNAKGYVFPIAVINASDIKSSKQIRLGLGFSYNNIRVQVCDINDDKVTIVPVNIFNCNWEKAQKFCQSLGEEWYIPSTEELDKIFSTEMNYYIFNNRCWGYDMSNPNDPKAVLYQLN